MKSQIFRYLVPVLLGLLTVACNQVKRDYYPNGNVRSAISMDGDHYHGQAKFYYEDGTLLMECSYLNDSLDGTLIRYYETGARREMMSYKRNNPNGVYQQWNPQGQLMVDCSYSDSLLDGNYKDYYDNGQIKSSGQYTSGEAKGLWLFYDQTGYVFKQENYE